MMPMHNAMIQQEVSPVLVSLGILEMALLVQVSCMINFNSTGYMYVHNCLPISFHTQILMNAAKAHITVIQMQIVSTLLEVSHAIAILDTAVMD